MTVGNPSVSKGAYIGIGNTQEGSSPAITYEEVGLVTGISAFGVEYDVVSFKPLKTGAEERLLAGYGVGTVTLTLGKDLSDTGQAAVKAALGVQQRCVTASKRRLDEFCGLGVSVSRRGLVRRVPRFPREQER